MTTGPDATLKVTMDRHGLAAHIRRLGIWPVTEMFRDAGSRVMLGLREGVNVTGWTMEAGPGVIRFARPGDDGQPVEMVVYLNTDNPDTIRNWTAELPDLLPCPYVLVTKPEGGIDRERDPHWLAVRAAWEAGTR